MNNDYYCQYKDLYITMKDGDLRFAITNNQKNKVKLISDDSIYIINSKNKDKNIIRSYNEKFDHKLVYLDIYTAKTNNKELLILPLVIPADTDRSYERTEFQYRQREVDNPYAVNNYISNYAEGNYLVHSISIDLLAGNTVNSSQKSSLEYKIVGYNSIVKYQDKSITYWSIKQIDTSTWLSKSKIIQCEDELNAILHTPKSTSNSKTENNKPYFNENMEF